MTHEEARRVIDRYRTEKARTSAAEYMAYMRAREIVGEPLTPGQRGFMAATRQQLQGGAE